MEGQIIAFRFIASIPFIELKLERARIFLILLRLLQRIVSNDLDIVTLIRSSFILSSFFSIYLPLRSGDTMFELGDFPGPNLTMCFLISFS